jgi:hypothetical protein
MNWLTYALLAMTLLTARHVAAAEPARPAPANGIAESLRITEWRWDSDQATVLYSMMRAGSSYDIAIVRQHDRPQGLLIKITDGGRQAYSWRGHWRSVFSLTGHRLIYADFAMETAGGEIVCVDLRQGKELWRSRLRAVPVGGHSLYSNAINLEVTDDQVLIYGNEEAGRYFEVKDARTGETIGHKVFPRAREGDQAATSGARGDRGDK